MKLLNLTILFFFLVITSNLKAQLNGTYTIGGVSPNYTTINSAVTALNTDGVSGPVMFKIRDGVYNERVIINTITGVSAFNLVTFCSESNDSTLVTIEHTPTNSNDFVVQLHEASYVIFKGVSIQTLASPWDSTDVFKFGGRSFYNAIVNCKLSQSNSKGCIIHSDILVDSANVIKENLLLNGEIGIQFSADTGMAEIESGNQIFKNKFLGQAGHAIYVNYQKSLKISDNYISMTILNPSNIGVTGIAAFNCGEGSIINNNNIIIRGDTASVVGIDLSGVGSTLNRIKVYNNCIDIKMDNGALDYGSVEGIDAFTISYSDIIYNSVNIYANSQIGASGVASRYAFRIYEGINNRILNNVFMNSSLTQDSTNLSIHSESGVGQIDYNDLYTNDAFLGIMFFQGLVATSLVEWQQLGFGFDPNSISINPLFSDSLLQLQYNSPLCGKGIWIPEITTDKNGNTRNNPPTIGAYEMAQPCTPNNVQINTFKENNELLIYPNPNIGKFIIQNTLSNKQNCIEITNLLGEIIYKTQSTSNIIELDLSKHGKGIYFVTVKNKDTFWCEKVIVE